MPRVVVTSDDTRITESCEVVIPPAILADANGNGVLHIVADRVTVRFAEGSILRGAPSSTPWDQLRGMGIRIEGRRGVRIEGARVHGYFNGLVATRADGLRIEGGDFSDNYRQRLRSTPAAEDGGDWLFPHHNDSRPWREQYGGAVCIERSEGVAVRGIRVRRGQNGILLDRVHFAAVYDNDCSFLSGWGLAMWRSSQNRVSRNAFDFCVRGHVEGVYNRGQDSAGILCFEQCNDNVFIENSATHGGDGFFGFAGREALGEVWLETERDRLRRETGRGDVEDRIRVPEAVARDLSGRGCNRNLIVGNDFSYAAAHGIEMTFSEGNVLYRNRLVENAICGFWGGYSSGTLIVENTFAGNGGMAYGLERGGINMEHAAHNRIQGNTFQDNKCAIHLWWDDDGALLRLPGVAGGRHEVTGNAIIANTVVVTPDHPFRGLGPDEPLIVLQLRDAGEGRVRGNRYIGNTVTLTAPGAIEVHAMPGTEPLTEGEIPRVEAPKAVALGASRPVGARPHLRGRDKIVLDEWGPWDHEAPLVRPGVGRDGEGVYEILGVAKAPAVDVEGKGLRHRLERQGPASWRLALAGEAGVTPFRAAVSGPDWRREWVGTLFSADWEVVFFPWSVDPREDVEAWRREASGPQAVRVRRASLDFAYGGGGPRDLPWADGALKRSGPGSDRFGMRAWCRVRLPAGRWRITTQSDDGVRVRVDGRVVIDNWTWHGPTRDEGFHEQDVEGEATIEVEHFEIDGWSVLRWDIEPAPASPGRQAALRVGDEV